jgi:4-amino-4-deoxy-L-arabinose transferase-like glycosyltransferase
MLAMFDFVLKKPLWVLIAIIVLGFGLRVYKIGAYGLAGDEKYSLFVSQFVSYDGNNQQNSVRNPKTPYFTPKEFWSEKDISGFYDAIARIDTGNGAFYTFLLHYWSKLVGLEDGNLRFLSLLFNLATIVLMYFFTKKYFSSTKIALTVAFLASISPFFINYSQIARNYSMQFFFTLLSTYLFLEIIENFKLKMYPILLYVLYGIIVLFAELCHISVFPLFFAHGIYILIFHRNLPFILKLSASFLIPILGMTLWLNSDGGRWLFHYVNNSVETYNLMAKNSPEEYLSVASFTTIIKQFRHLISCVFISAEGLYLKLAGATNFIITIFLSILAYICFVYIKNENLKFATILLLILMNLAFVSVSNLHYFVLFSNLFLLCFVLHHSRRIINQNKPILLLILIAVISLLFLVVFAFKDGNTFRIITRYVGFCYATNLILTVYFIRELFLNSSNSKYLILTGFVVQFGFLLRINNSIYQDNSPRYFMSHAAKRNENPYTILAKNIEKLYQKGDTVLYCSLKDNYMPKGYDLPAYSVVDAQLTNFYLPKNAEFIQRVDKNEPNKVFLKNANGKMIELFDFEGIKYRY